MSVFAFALAATAAIFALGSIIFSRCSNGPTPTPPPRDSYYSSTPTWKFPRPPRSPPPYIRRPPATGAHSHTTSRTSSTFSDELAGVEDAQKLREEARRRGLEMKEAHSRAKSAQKKGSRGAAQEHRQRGLAHKSAMKELDKRAAEIIFREKNKNRKEGMIDLHGLHVAEAIRVAKDQVQSARSRGDKVVHFIVGKGLHANDGEAKIRPALQGLFTKQGLTHSLDPKNSGVVIIQL